MNKISASKFQHRPLLQNHSQKTKVKEKKQGVTYTLRTHESLTIPSPFCRVDIDHLLRGTKLNRTYGKHKKLYISLFLLTTFGPIYYGPL